MSLPKKVRLVKAMVFPVVMYGCESWTIKKVERRRIYVFELWCWRRESPLNCKEIKPVSRKLKYFGHLMWQTYSLEKTLMLGKIEGRKRRGWQRMRCLHGTTDSMDMSRLRELMRDREARRAEVHGVTKSQTQLSYWAELNWETFLVVTKGQVLLASNE